MNLRSILYGALTRIAFVAAAALLMTAQASAEVQPARWSSLSLTFLQPTGVAGPSDSIDVWLRFANTDPTGAFTVDNSLPNGGLNSADLPRQGWGTDAGGTSIYADFSSYTNFSLATWFGCSGTFTKTCTDGPPYSFTWASGSPLAVPFSLAPGQTLDYLHGSFIPSAGPVAAGNYNFYRSLIAIDVNGLDAVGNDLRQLVYLTQTCTGDSVAACATQSYFTRTVGAVPEPGTYAMMALGLGIVGWQLRRRRQWPADCVARLA
jgi:hypothetical protein